MSTLRSARYMYKRSVFALKQSARLTGVLARQVHTAGSNGEPGGERCRASKRALSAGALALALLAADHVFNGAYNITTPCIVVLKPS